MRICIVTFQRFSEHAVIFPVINEYRNLLVGSIPLMWETGYTCYIEFTNQLYTPHMNISI